MIKEKQFENNLGILSKTEFEIISKLRVIIVGLGGLGGNLVNSLLRLGVKDFLLVDFDLFEESNLNRQLFSNHNNIGAYKVDVIKEELLHINPSAIIETKKEKIEELDDSLINEYDYLIDCVDSIETKVYLSEVSSKFNIPLLHGACAGWYGQIAWIMPGCNLIKETYEAGVKGLESDLLNPSFTPAVVSSVMASEFTKFVLNKKATINEFLLIDLLHNNMIKTGDKNG